jgi:tRNA (Thr-GGU) A37 N-methylase
VISNIEVFKKYEEWLKDIEGFSHIIVLYWMSKSEGYTLQITTPWDTELASSLSVVLPVAGLKKTTITPLING